MRVEFPLLNEGEYETWLPKMEAVLIEAGLDGVTFGDETRPSGSPNSKPVLAFTKKQRSAKAKIVLHVHASQLPHTQVSGDPRAIWDELRRVHRPVGFGSLLAMRRSFYSMKQRVGESALSWIGRVRTAGFVLAQTGYAVDEIDRILVLTQGLDEEYRTFRATLEMNSSLTFQDVVVKILNEQSRQHFDDDKDEGSFVKTEPPNDALHAMAAVRRHAQKSGKIYCHKCGGIGHMRAACPSRSDISINCPSGSTPTPKSLQPEIAGNAYDSDSDYDVAA